MDKPFDIEAAAARAYELHGEGADRTSFLLGFASGAEVLNRFWLQRTLEAKADPSA